MMIKHFNRKCMGIQVIDEILCVPELAIQLLEFAERRRVDEKLPFT